MKGRLLMAERALRGISGFSFPLALLSLVTASCGSSSSGGANNAPAVSGDGGCGTLVDNAQSVVHKMDTGPAPTPMGGTIADGTYVKTGAASYQVKPGTPTETDFSEVIRVTGSTFERSYEEYGGTFHDTVSTVTASGNTLTLKAVCPPGASTDPDLRPQYTATPTQLDLYVTALEVNTYTRQ
jgi:hypothetical protein